MMASFIALFASVLKATEARKKSEKHYLKLRNTCMLFFLLSHLQSNTVSNLLEISNFLVKMKNLVMRKEMMLAMLVLNTSKC
jgi:hypothetical protein